MREGFRHEFTSVTFYRVKSMNLGGKALCIDYANKYALSFII